MRVDGGATIATLVRPPRHRSPRATEDGGGIANPGCNGYIQHGGEPPRSKLGQTWFIDHEAHLLQSRLIVNSHLPFAHFGSSLQRIGSLVLKNKELPMLVLSHCGQLPVLADKRPENTIRKMDK